jgi:probable HAF family extracellular repeat protein
MSYWKSFGLAILAAACLLGETTGSAPAQCNPCATEWSDGSVIKLGSLPGSTDSEALAINNAGQAVGSSGGQAVEWSGGSVINLGPGYAESINNAGQAVGYSPGLALWSATEWSGGSVIHLQNLPGATESLAYGINDAGQVVGMSQIGIDAWYATEWSGGSVINLGGLPNTYPNVGNSINDAGQVVGALTAEGGLHIYATEWSAGSVINLGLGEAFGINNAGQAVGVGSLNTAAEWSGGSVINLANLPGAIGSTASDINDAGLVVGSTAIGEFQYATEWSGSSIIDLGALPGYTYSFAQGINDVGQAVGYSLFIPPPAVPEPSTWAMMLVGFAGLARAGYRRAKTRHAFCRAQCARPYAMRAGSGRLEAV